MGWRPGGTRVKCGPRPADGGPRPALRRSTPAAPRRPAPPAAALRAFAAFELRGLDGAVRADVREQLRHAGRVLPAAALRALHRPVPIACALRVPPVQREIAERRETGLVRPAFEDRAFGEQFVQPLRRVPTEPREQHQVRAARNDMDGVDLQHAHACDRGQHVGLARAPARSREQALRRKVQAARLPGGEPRRSGHVVASRQLRGARIASRRSGTPGTRSRCG